MLVSAALTWGPPPQTVAPTLPTPVQCDRTEGPCWAPPKTLRWQWQIYCPEDPGAKDCIDASVRARMYDIDGFDSSASLVAGLHAHGVHAICYIDAGTRESWRPDAGQFPSFVVGKPLDAPWTGQRWLDVRRIDAVGPVMEHRMDMCRDKGFDGIQFDDLAGWQEKTGFDITWDDQLAYNMWLANEAHEWGLSAAFENDIEQAPELVGYYDWAIFEECNYYRECQQATAFLESGKFVGEVEYRNGYADMRFCQGMQRLGFNAMYKHRMLGPLRRSC